MIQLIAAPLLIPLATAALSLLLWHRVHAQRWLAVVGTAGLLLVAMMLLISLLRGPGVFAVQIGDWPFPYGISLVADLFSAIMVVLAAMMGLATAVYSLTSMDRSRESFGYYPLLHILLMGVCGAFLTGDIFNLYVWFEVMLMASFVLLALGGEPGQLSGAIKYVTLNLLASAIFLAAVGILYGMVGTLNMADLAVKLNSDEVEPGLVTALSMLFLIAFGIKAALFPLFFWLPASYHTPPVAVSAIFAGLLTKVGVYALVRVFTLLFISELAFTHGLILLLAGLTMVTGVLGAAAQNEFRRILSFHIVSQIGYMVMGLGLFGLTSSTDVKILALAGSIFYIMHHIIVKTNLFLVSGLADRLRGSFELKKLGGLYQDYPGLSLFFLIPALSLAGLPPLSGFFAKLALVQAGLAAGQYAIVATALVVGLLTLFSMSKIWAEAFWKSYQPDDRNNDSPHETLSAPSGKLSFMYGPVIVLASITVVIGLAAEPVFTLATRAAEQLANPSAYLQAVRGDLP